LKQPAIRVAAGGLLVLVGLGLIWSVFGFLLLVSNGEAQDPYYVAAAGRSLRPALFIPTIVILLAFAATFKRNQRGTVGLWLVLAGAVLMTMPGVVFILPHTLWTEAMPHRVSEYGQTSSMYCHLAALYLVALVGLVGVVAGGIFWGVSVLRRRGEPTA
jgi:hypothetical protein